MRTDAFLGVAYPVLLDGAMGTQLAARGLQMGGQNCLSNPDAVRDIHRAYVEAGADILITNTLTMNRVYIETHKVGVGVEEVNIAGARLAREASGGRPVLGDISSTGQLLEPYGECSEEQAFAAFREQAQHLANTGVHGFIVETMLDLREALCAARACRAVADLPVVMTLSFQTTDQGGRTIMGNSAAEIAEAASATEDGRRKQRRRLHEPPELPETVEDRRCGGFRVLVGAEGADQPAPVNGQFSARFRDDGLDCLDVLPTVPDRESALQDRALEPVTPQVTPSTRRAGAVEPARVLLLRPPERVVADRARYAVENVHERVAVLGPNPGLAHAGILQGGHRRPQRRPSTTLKKRALAFSGSSRENLRTVNPSLIAFGIAGKCRIMAALLKGAYEDRT
jgi:hypothetical protein